jgi:hypothetical protein
MDERALRARIICAVEGEIEGSPYLLALAACEAEEIEGANLLDQLGAVTEFVS